MKHAIVLHSDLKDTYKLTHTAKELWIKYNTGGTSGFTDYKMTHNTGCISVS